MSIDSATNSRQSSQQDFAPVQVEHIQQIDFGSKPGSRNQGNLPSRYNRKIVTTKHLKTGEEELKINLESQLGERPEKKLNSSTNMDFINSKALRSSFNNAASNQKMSEKSKNFGFNSFIGSGNTP